MTYELAKQLKDAGFPQEGGEHFMNYENPKIPTLSELIKACGDIPLELHRKKSGIWMAIAYDGKMDWIKGSTPEEAIARLWMVLIK